MCIRDSIKPDSFEKIYGVDINKEYLKECTARYKSINNILECLCIDLTNNASQLPYADIVVADLLVEYIGYECFRKIIGKVNPKYVSCVIQINTDVDFVSDSPYLHVFDGLNSIHYQMNEDELSASMLSISYRLTDKSENILPNGKKLVRLDFQK